jgi:hypothetical protein
MRPLFVAALDAFVAHWRNLEPAWVSSFKKEYVDERPHWSRAHVVAGFAIDQNALERCNRQYHEFTAHELVGFIRYVDNVSRWVNHQSLEMCSREYGCSYATIDRTTDGREVWRKAQTLAALADDKVTSCVTFFRLSLKGFEGAVAIASPEFTHTCKYVL